MGWPICVRLCMFVIYWAYNWYHGLGLTDKGPKNKAWSFFVIFSFYETSHRINRPHPIWNQFQFEIFMRRANHVSPNFFSFVTFTRSTQPELTDSSILDKSRHQIEKVFGLFEEQTSIIEIANVIRQFCYQYKTWCIFFTTIEHRSSSVCATLTQKSKLLMYIRELFRTVLHLPKWDKW